MVVRTLLAVFAFLAAALAFTAIAQDCRETGRPMSRSQYQQACYDCGGRIVGSGTSMRCVFDVPATPTTPQRSEEDIEREHRAKEAEAISNEAMAAERRGDWEAAAAYLRRALTRKQGDEDFKKRLKTAEAHIARQQADRAAQGRVNSLYQSITRPGSNTGSVDFAGSSTRQPDLPLATLSPRQAPPPDFASLPQTQSTTSRPVDFADADESGLQYSRRETLETLRKDVERISEALRRLNKTIASDNAQRTEWEKATDTAMENAWKRGKSMVVDGGIWFIDKRIAKQLESVNAEIRRAATLVSGETDPARRERLHAAVRLLEQQRQQIRDAQNEAKDVLPKLRRAKLALETVAYAQSNTDDREKFMKGAYMLLKIVLKEDKVQRALEHGKEIYGGAKYAQSIIDSAYDITTEAIAWRRLNQLNRNSEQYLWAVDSLQKRMEKTVRKIHELERTGA